MFRRLAFVASIVLLAGSISSAATYDLPLVVSEVSYDPGQKISTFTLRNDGTVGVVAWYVSITARYPDGSRAHYSRSLDVYLTAAGLADVPVNLSLKLGETRRVEFPSPRKEDGAAAEGVDVRVVAVVLDGNVAMGDPARLDDIFTNRRRDAQYWDDVHAALRGEGSMASGVQALRAAAERLNGPGPKQPHMELTRTNVLLAIKRVERGQEDPAHALSALILHAKQTADAARKFSVPAVP